MADLFWAYWDATVRFALLAFLLLLLTPLLKRMISPRLLCWAWALLLLRLALPFSLPFSGSIFNMHENLQPSAWTEALRRGVVEAGWGETIMPVFRDEDHLIIANRIPFSWESTLMVLWMLGAAVMAVRLLRNALQLKAFFGKAELHDSGRLYDIFKDTRKRIGIYANVPLMVSAEVKTPGIAGVFNPRIIIPKHCAERLSDSELRCVFMHELMHYRRGDLFLHHALLILCYIHWYNPIVWLALKQFKDEMEKACDLEVVDSVCSGSAQEYGYTLLQVLRLSAGAQYSPGGALSLLGSRSKSALRERIELIARSRRRNPLLVGLGLAVFGSSFLFAMTGELEPEKEAFRLVKLTRLSGPFQAEEAESFGLPYQGETGAENFPISEERREWVRIVDGSRFAGKRVEVRAVLRFDRDVAFVDLWASANDIGDRSMASNSVRLIEEDGVQVAIMLIEAPVDAVKFNYGLSFRGSGMAWVESVRVTPLSDVVEPGL